MSRVKSYFTGSLIAFGLIVPGSVVNAQNPVVEVDSSNQLNELNQSEQIQSGLLHKYPLGKK